MSSTADGPSRPDAKTQAPTSEETPAPGRSSGGRFSRRALSLAIDSLVAADDPEGSTAPHAHIIGTGSAPAILRGHGRPRTQHYARHRPAPAAAPGAHRPKAPPDAGAASGAAPPQGPDAAGGISLAAVAVWFLFLRPPAIQSPGHEVPIE